MNIIIRLYKFISMSALAISQIEKHFITNQIYKRSKRYFDVTRLNSIQLHQQKQRRKPCNSRRQTIQNKIQLSFVSSQDFYNQRRTQQLSRLKKITDEQDQIQTNYSFITKSNLKSFDMEKLLPRQFFTTKKQTHGVQNQFDNYFVKNITKPKGRSFDFSKFVGRKSQKQFKQEAKNKQKNIKEDEQEVKNPQTSKNKDNKRKTAYQLNKQYEKIVFNDALFKCLFTDEQQHRRVKKNQNNKQSLSNMPKQLDIQKIQKGRKATSKNQFASYYPFYNGKGKQQVSQMHMKCLKKNQNYYEPSIKQYDFQVVKRKQDMILQRIAGIKQRKIVHDEKDEMCSQKFFRRYKKNIND